VGEFPAEIDDEALDHLFTLSGTTVAEARQRRHDGTRLRWSSWLCGPLMLGFCVNDVIMTPACRPETVVFSPLMLLPGVDALRQKAESDPALGQLANQPDQMPQ
jgi:hypothetical protein